MATLTRKKTKKTEPEYYANTRRMASILADKKCEDIKGYDVEGMTIVADAFLMCSVNSEPQMKAAYNSIIEGMKEVGVKPFHHEGDTGGGWVLVDYSSVIVHIFRKEARTFYDLDAMWADAPAIELHLDS